MRGDTKVTRQQAKQFLETALRNAPKVVLDADSIDDTADALEAFLRNRMMAAAKIEGFD